MTFCTVTCLCLALIAGAYADVQPRIVGGTNTAIEHYPFQVSLRKNGHHFCGGSIIGSRYILTAGHCLSDFSTNSVTVVTGTSKSTGTSGKSYRASLFTIHPNYSDYDVSNDIGVITLRSSITFDASTKQISLPSRDTQKNEKATVTGWGLQDASHTTIPTILQKASTTVIGNPTCSSQLNRLGLRSIRDDQICAFQKIGVGACNGDSGGPLTANNEVIGIVSFGIPCARGYPDVYTRVYSYKSWIQKVMTSK